MRRNSGCRDRPGRWWRRYRPERRVGRMRAPVRPVMGVYCRVPLVYGIHRQFLYGLKGRLGSSKAYNCGTVTPFNLSKLLSESLAILVYLSWTAVQGDPAGISAALP